jgi:hypothetical protein
MALTLEQYANWLETRDLPWPAAPPVEPVRARPHLAALPKVRAVLWNVYGTLLQIPPHGELLFEHPQEFVMSMALEKTITEFKMWGSMTRKPGQPSAYMYRIYRDLYDQQRLAPAVPGEHHSAVLSEKVWEGVLKRLMQKDYVWDAGFFGSLNEYAKKVAFFFHASLQASAIYHGADSALAEVAADLPFQGLLADAQCFTVIQLQRALKTAGSQVRLDGVCPPEFRFLSCDWRGRKPSDRLFRHALEKLAERRVRPDEVLHVGNHVARDIEPAKKFGMRTALFAGDKASLVATAEQLKDPRTRPDLLLTELGQIAECV